MPTLRHHAHRIRLAARPAGRKAYELWDLGLIVMPVSLLWYVLTAPSPTTIEALSDTLNRLLQPQVWGYTLAGAGVLAVVLSYGPRLAVRAGFVVMVVVCTAWSVSLVIGLVFTMPDWQMAGKTLGVAWVFGGLASRAFRDGIAADPDDHTMTDNSKAADDSAAA